MVGFNTSTSNNNNNNNNNNNSHSQINSMLLLISSTSSNHQFPQNHQLIDEKQSISNSSLMMASPPILMEKSNPNQNQQQQQQYQHQQNNQQSLKCPRCDSSNTKFCYYNNYSLSQPRHFCKACKRYWTRGGTLRNVPVGGGCRKNKRVKRPSSISAVDSPNSSSTPSSNTNLQSSSSNPIINPPLFYGIPTSTDHPTHLNLPYTNFNSRVLVSGYEGLGFSSGLMDYPNPNGFNPKEIQDVVNSNSLLSRYPIFGSSNLQQQQQKFMGLLPYEDMQIMGSSSNSDGNMVIKEVKMEESQNKLNWSSATQMDQIGSYDPSILWSTPGVGSWLDPSNIGSSVPSLI